MKRQMLLFVLLASSVSLLSAQTNWAIDKTHSNVMFTVRHLLISEVTGRFDDFDVTMTSSRDDFTDAAIQATVNVESVNTENERRDTHLRSDDFFNAEKFPQMKFVSRSIKKIADDKYQLTGDLAIRDVTKEVTFDTTLLGVVAAGRMGTRAGWKATTTINRFDYNLKWDRALETGGLVVGKDVTINLNLEFVQKAGTSQ
jgi:polyisoprenoid-binding protein YceI